MLLVFEHWAKAIGKLGFLVEICLSDVYLGRISRDSPSSLIFHNFNVKWIVIPYFYVNGSQLGADIHSSQLH